MSSPASVPASREFAMLGITYGLYTVGLVMFWPAIVGLIVAYIKRDDVADSFLGSHYRWLIRTFWWWAAGFAVAIGAIVAMVVPSALEVSRTMPVDMVKLPWSMLGGAIGGGLFIMGVWFWVVYRLVRGTLRLADGRAVP